MRMNRDLELQRFSELLDALADLAGQRTDLQLRGSALEPLGFAARLQPQPASSGVELLLSLSGARLSVWTGDGRGDEHRAAEQALHLDLSTGFRWESLVFPDAGTLAHTLLKWMEDEVTGDGRGTT